MWFSATRGKTDPETNWQTHSCDILLPRKVDVIVNLVLHQGKLRLFHLTEVLTRLIEDYCLCWDIKMHTARQCWEIASSNIMCHRWFWLKISLVMGSCCSATRGSLLKPVKTAEVPVLWRVFFFFFLKFEWFCFWTVTCVGCRWIAEGDRMMVNTLSQRVHVLKCVSFCCSSTFDLSSVII